MAAADPSGGADSSMDSNSVSSGTSKEIRLRLATFNILADCFPWIVRLAIDSETRFASLVEQVRRLDADVLMLNEVTKNSLKALLDSEFVRESYHVSELATGVNGTLGTSHGCVIFSKIPMRRSYALGLCSRKTEAIIGLFSIAGRSVAVCSVHTTPIQSERNKAIRASQIAQVADFAKQQEVDGFFIAGDLNLHYISEDGVVLANQLLDAWAETHFCASGDQNPGFTFDADMNAMIPHYIPGEVRKMRLDRILASESCCLVPSRPCELWATDAVDQSRHLFLSDHFGLVQELRLSGDGWRGDAAARRQLLENSKVPLEANPASYLQFGLALPSHIAWLAFRLLGFW